jgi:hypothetical protein
MNECYNITQSRPLTFKVKVESYETRWSIVVSALNSKPGDHFVFLFLISIVFMEHVCLHACFIRTCMTNQIAAIVSQYITNLLQDY